jgi:hypothetical protein
MPLLNSRYPAISGDVNQSPKPTDLTKQGSGKDGKDGKGGGK